MQMGIETTKELDLVVQIKGEVRKLGTQSHIIRQLGALEQKEFLEKHEARLLQGTTGDLSESTSQTPSSSTFEYSFQDDQSRKDSESRLNEFKSFSQSLSQSLQEAEFMEKQEKKRDDDSDIQEDIEEERGETPALNPKDDAGDEKEPRDRSDENVIDHSSTENGDSISMESGLVQPRVEFLESEKATDEAAAAELMKDETESRRSTEATDTGGHCADEESVTNRSLSEDSQKIEE